jgi:YHS domain-containing protein
MTAISSNQKKLNENCMKRLVVFIVWAVVLSNVANAQTTKRVKEFNLDSKRLALSGYDPVSYFQKRRAIKGDPSITAAYEGVTYRFISEANKNTFLASPTNYEPQYGGWCAYAMGLKGEKVEVDPQTFKIADGKLYLFYNRFFQNTLDSWNEDELALKGKADKNWNKLIAR